VLGSFFILFVGGRRLVAKKVLSAEIIVRAEEVVGVVDRARGAHRPRPVGLVGSSKFLWWCLGVLQSAA